MRILICGDRNWTNKQLIFDTLHEFCWHMYNTKGVSKFWVIEGEANGADSLGREVAEEMGFEVMKFPAEWDKFHRAAGPIRNQQMLQQGQPDYAFAFHNDLSKSKGTIDMVRRLRKAGIPVEVINE